MQDDDVVTAIRQDGIDILVDLAGHTSFNRLLVFARKAAPVQVTWLGYPNTTGLKTMDYRLTDAIADPPGEADRLHTEKLVRLEHGFLCYQADDTRLEVAEPPCTRRGHVTFGTFNTIKKISAEVVVSWAAILKCVPGSQLALKGDGLNDASTKAGLLESFKKQGITEDRLRLIDWAGTREEHLKLYSEIDIALDPFPYNGTTTTCEALWMGVPVICLRGDRHAGRVGASIMHHAGFGEFVADSREEYTALASRLAEDPSRRAKLRNTLRDRLRESPLMNVQQFTETLESAYRAMWHRWCGNKR